MPESIRNVDQLDAMLSEPTDVVVQTMREVTGDILVLGVAGKMGPVLSRMAVRASVQAGIKRRVVGVARNLSAERQSDLEADGIDTVQADLLDEATYQALPDAENVVFLVGQKFGTNGAESTTWATNTQVPGFVTRRFPRSRIVVLSTGNVYGLSRVDGGGSKETHEPRPQGEYAMSALGRERIFEYASRTSGTPVAILRLCYASEMRYGVLVDLAKLVWTGQTIDLSVGHINVIWEADACAMILASLGAVESPPAWFNLTGPEILSVREVSLQLARQMGRDVTFVNQPASDALLVDGSNAIARWGQPRVDAKQLIEWTADWVMRGQADFNKPTHFESRDGRF